MSNSLFTTFFIRSHLLTIGGEPAGRLERGGAVPPEQTETKTLRVSGDSRWWKESNTSNVLFRKRVGMKRNATKRTNVLKLETNQGVDSEGELSDPGYESIYITKNIPHFVTFTTKNVT